MLHTRMALAEDDSFLYEVYAFTRMNEVIAWGWGEQEIHTFLMMQWTMQRKSYQMQYPSAANLIIYDDAKQVGRLMIDRTPQTINLIDISLLPAYRNLGIGSELIRMLQKEATERNVQLHLQVFSNNPAIRLYERHGFKTYSTSDMYRRMCWKYDGTSYGEGIYK
jgi:ribosomal protein S18 acetylase RimI-like enzyme